jgi:1,4-dihydroxy-2-naphthoate octaprenyltransferase
VVRRVAAGLLACAVLLANNLRDIDQDRLAGKRTLTVRIGKRATQVVFTVFVLGAFAITAFLALVYPLAWLGLLALIPAHARSSSSGRIGSRANSSSRSA